MLRKIFTQADTWTGGSYDLGIELGPRNDLSLRRAVDALWSHPDLEGCYLFPDVEPGLQTRIEASAVSVEQVLHGVARVGKAAPLACRTIVVRFDGGSDWVYFSFPIGSLSHVYDVGAYPIRSGSDTPWKSSVDNWLAELGQRVFDAVPFRLGLVGWDGGDVSDAISLQEHGVPSERWFGYLVPDEGRLKWFASNQQAPFTVAP